MIPLRDTLPSERTPVANWLLIAANVAVFVFVARALPDDESRQAFAERFGIVPGRVRTGLSQPGLLLEAPGPWLRDVVLPFFSAMFVHGGLAHLVGNLWFLFVFGDNVEGRLGPARYLAFYAACGVVASALHVALVPEQAVVGATWWGAAVSGRNAALDVPMIGASGAIAGVLGAYAVAFPRSRVDAFLPPIFVLPVPAVLFLALWFVGQFIAAGAVDLAGGLGVGVAYWAHVGGFVAGLAFAFTLFPRARTRR